MPPAGAKISVIVPGEGVLCETLYIYQTKRRLMWYAPSRPFLTPDNEGTVWARGWTTPEALALRTTEAL